MHDDCALGPVSNSNSNSDSARDFEMATADPEFLRRYSVPHLPLPFPLDKDVFIPDPSLGSKRTKSLVFREYIPIKTLGNGRYGAVKEAMHVSLRQADWRAGLGRHPLVTCHVMSSNETMSPDKENSP